MSKRKSVNTYDNDKEISFKNKDRDRFYQRMSSEQHELFDSIQNNAFTMCRSRAGTGKTTVTVAAMLDMLSSGRITKIIYLQSASPRFLEHGYLPGSLEEKTANLYVALYDALETLGINEWETKSLIENEQLMLKTDSDLRGCNFENAGVILDEVENMDYRTLKLILTRVHDSCFTVMIGDELQKDGHGDNTAFIDYGEYLVDKLPGKAVTLTRNFRGRLSRLAEEYEPNN